MYVWLPSKQKPVLASAQLTLPEMVPPADQHTCACATVRLSRQPDPEKQESSDMMARGESSTLLQEETVGSIKTCYGLTQRAEGSYLYRLDGGTPLHCVPRGDRRPMTRNAGKFLYSLFPHTRCVRKIVTRSKHEHSLGLANER